MTMFLTVRLRLVLWYGSVLALSMAALGGGTYLTVRASLTRQLRADLERDYSAVESALRDDPRELEELEDHAVVALFQATREGEEVYRTSGWLRFGLDEALDAGVGGSSWRWDSFGGDQHFLLKAGEMTEGGSSWRFVVAEDMEGPIEGLRALAVTLLVGFPLVLLLAAVGGYFLAGRVLAPVGSMAEKAREISADQLSKRLPIKNPDDEFGRLAAVFNDVLARLERSFDQLRRFTADASHELRTPLTAMRTVGEVGLRKDGDPSHLREVIGSMLEETDRLTGLVDVLLTLTRSEGGPDSLTLSEVDLLALTQECVDLLQALAEEKDQTISVRGDMVLMSRGDRRLLRQALLNLLDNAIRYSPHGGSISLAVGRTPTSEAMVEVADEGPGIAPQEQEKVFERFYRAESKRPGKAPGVGLGLSIVRWAVEAHGGRVEVESEVGRGSVFRMVLPEGPSAGSRADASRGAELTTNLDKKTKPNQ